MVKDLQQTSKMQLHTHKYWPITVNSSNHVAPLSVEFSQSYRQTDQVATSIYFDWHWMYECIIFIELESTLPSESRRSGTTSLCYLSMTAVPAYSMWLISRKGKHIQSARSLTCCFNFYCLSDTLTPACLTLVAFYTSEDDQITRTTVR